jgi:hypothetical protein
MFGFAPEEQHVWFAPEEQHVLVLLRRSNMFIALQILIPVRSSGAPCVLWRVPFTCRS